MNKIVAASLCLVASGSAYAAESAKPSVPPPASSFTVTLSINDIQAIAASLNSTAGQCATLELGCDVGKVKGAIIQKLQDAISKPSK